MPRKSASKSTARPSKQALTDLPATPASPADESQVKGGLTSKYIGETEKNLNRVLSSTQQADATLLFDEGDQLLK
jgi:hypothetical protein